MSPEEARPALARVAPIERGAAPVQVQEVPLEDPFSAEPKDDNPFDAAARRGRHGAGTAAAGGAAADSDAPCIQHGIFGADRSRARRGGGAGVARGAAADAPRPRRAAADVPAERGHLGGRGAAAVGAIVVIVAFIVGIPRGARRPRRVRPTRRRTTPACAAVAELKASADRLKREVEELRASWRPSRPDGSPVASSAFSREREFLNLRERSTRRKTRSSISATRPTPRSARSSTARTGCASSERRDRATSKGSLGTEKELVAAKEKIEALAARQGARGRAREAGQGPPRRRAQEIARYEDEIEGWKKKHANDVGQAEQTYNEAVASHQTEAGRSCKQQHQATIERSGRAWRRRCGARSTRTKRKRRSWRAKHDEERGRLEAEHAAALERLRESKRQRARGHAAALRAADRPRLQQQSRRERSRS